MQLNVQDQIDALETRLNNLDRSANIPIDTETALRERLGLVGLTGTGVVHATSGKMSVSGIVVSDFASNIADTDGTLAANSDSRIATQKATKTYVDTSVAGSSANIFGDGSDSAGVISGDTTLARDMYYTTLVVNSGVKLDVNGFKVFAKTSITNAGTIRRNGNDGGNGGNGQANGGGSAAGGTAGAGGVALTAGSLASVGAGKDGTVGGQGSTGGSNDGSNGIAGGNTGDLSYLIGTTTKAPSKTGGTGYGNGVNSGGAGGSTGTAGTFTASTNPPRNATQAIMAIDTSVTVSQYQSSANSLGATGGGGGAGNNATSNFGGGGGGGGGTGSNGGVLLLVSPTITNAGTISANGGNGGNGGNAGNGTCGDTGAVGAGAGATGAGGNGGNGGAVILVYKTLTNSGTISVAGGTGGSPGSVGTSCGTGIIGGTAGASGSNGATGTIYQIQL